MNNIIAWIAPCHLFKMRHRNLISLLCFNPRFSHKVSIPSILLALCRKYLWRNISRFNRFIFLISKCQKIRKTELLDFTSLHICWNLSYVMYRNILYNQVPSSTTVNSPVWKSQPSRIIDLQNMYVIVMVTKWAPTFNPDFVCWINRVNILEYMFYNFCSDVIERLWNNIIAYSGWRISIYIHPLQNISISISWKYKSL